MAEPKYDLEERLLEFSVRIVRVTESMTKSRAANHLADQLLRSGTSPYGHHGEAEGAESRDDFVHKLKVCYKELRESRRWLRLVGRVPLVAKPELLASCSPRPTSWSESFPPASAPRKRIGRLGKRVTGKRTLNVQLLTLNAQVGR